MPRAQQRSSVIASMASLDPANPAERMALERSTAQLICMRERPDAELAAFLATQNRPLAGFEDLTLSRPGRILVTGGTGCVGYAVLSGLVAAGAARLVSIARRPPPPQRRVDGVVYRQADVRDEGAMRQLLGQERPDTVVHLAAQRNPGRAEREVGETVSTNVFGTMVVLEAAGMAQVETVTLASTGKANRFFTSDVYAASKKLMEYVASRAAERWQYRLACARFTHVVDNSLVFASLNQRINDGAPLPLHGPDIMFPIQSARECYHLLITGAHLASPGRAKVVALRNLGWPPLDLLGLALDLIAARGSRSPIQFTGFPPGYEAAYYPGTYDPMTAGEVTPLFNALEASRARPASVLSQSVDAVSIGGAASAALDEMLRDIGTQVWAEPREVIMRHALRAATLEQFRLTMAGAKQDQLQRIGRFGSTFNPEMTDHCVIQHHIASLLEASGAKATGVGVG